MTYRHTQIAWPNIAILLVVLPLIMVATGGMSVLLPLVIAAPMLLVFGGLTVVVDEERLSWRFGIGLIRKSVPIKKIQSLRAVRNPWYYGWGIRFTPRGWLYNVAGLSAIEVGLMDGKHVLIGTDEPEALERALKQLVVPSGPEELVLARPPSARKLILVQAFTAPMCRSRASRRSRCRTRFCNRGIPPYVVVKTSDSYVIVNFKDPQQTRALYEELRKHAKKP